MIEGVGRVRGGQRATLARVLVFIYLVLRSGSSGLEIDLPGRMLAGV